MAHRLPVYLVLLGASLATFGMVLAQAPPDASNSPAASPAETPAAPAQSPAPSSAQATTPAAPATSPAPAAPAGPSADTLKKARLAGFHPETKNGAMVFCQETASLGTRFPTKKCINEQQLQGVLDVQNQTHDSLRKPTTLDPAR